jgi:hypothetical protein
MHPCVGPLPNGAWNTTSHHESAGSSPITTGNISKRASFWRTFVKSKWVMRWIDHGYDLVWDKLPRLARQLKNFESSRVHSDFVTQEIADMLEAGAASALPPGVIPKIVSPRGVVTKARSTKLRLIINMIYVSDHLAKRVFKLEGLSDLADMSEKGDYSISYDLTSGYYHVPLHSDSRRFVGFQWKGVFYQYNCLPFGLSTSPWVFSKIIRELVMYWMAKGINILPYLDDLLFLICGYEAGVRLRFIIEKDMRLAGLSINWDKSDNNPLQERIHLGFIVNLAKGFFRSTSPDGNPFTKISSRYLILIMEEFKHGSLLAKQVQLPI